MGNMYLFPLHILNAFFPIRPPLTRIGFCAPIVHFTFIRTFSIIYLFNNEKGKNYGKKKKNISIPI